jgi:hypothetical protein
MVVDNIDNKVAIVTESMYIRESKLEPAKIYFDWKTN